MTAASSRPFPEMPIVATAGHVDHGKSTLVEALTGRDPDRWAEEKERGLTIDLGFAWATIGGFTVGFVDVPGHERFIKNMLAGVGAVDVALFVVAADEGWMPQSEEHLAILDLLETAHGVIALTRIDLTDEDTIDLAELGVLEAVEDTTMSNWPIVRVSAVTGVGMDALQVALSDALKAGGTPADGGRPRVWIDRSFHVPGAGLVVTGTLSGGSIADGDELMLWPGEVMVRVRGLQSHDAAVDHLDSGTRAALNIVGTDDVARGAMLAIPGSFRSSNRLLASVRLVRNFDGELTGRGAFHLHAGSGAWPVEVRVIESAPAGAVVLLRSRQALPLEAGHLFVLRETGRRAVIGGGTVLDPRPPESGTALREAIPVLRAVQGSSPDQIADALLEVRGSARVADLASDSGGGQPSSVYRTGTLVMAEGRAIALHGRIVSAVEQFHRENRLRSGMPKATLASTLGVEPEAVAALIAGSNEIADDGSTVRLAAFSPGLAVAEQQAWEKAKVTLLESLAVPRASQLGLGVELLHALVRANALVRVSEDLVYLPDQIEAIDRRFEELPAEFTVAEFRDLIGITRRQAIPLLEWFDKQGKTARKGDLRSVRAAGPRSLLNRCGAGSPEQRT